jgi:hypothetical protein
MEIVAQDGAAFTKEKLVGLMDRTLLLSIENVYRLKEDGLDLIEFTRFFMNCLEHSEKEAPFLAAGLAQLFEAVARGKSKICFSGLTDYIC